MHLQKEEACPSSKTVFSDFSSTAPLFSTHFFAPPFILPLLARAFHPEICFTAHFTGKASAGQVTATAVKMQQLAMQRRTVGCILVIAALLFNWLFMPQFCFLKLQLKAEKCDLTLISSQVVKKCVCVKKMHTDPPSLEALGKVKSI